MKLITQRQLIQKVAARWRQQYEPFKDQTPMFSVRAGIEKLRSKREISEELDALDGDTATAQQVDAIIGNGSWTRMNCDQCKKEVTSVLRVGAELDYESATADLCEECVAQACKVEWPSSTETPATFDRAPSQP